MADSSNNSKIYNFLNSQIHGVVGTVDGKGDPEGAWVGFGQTEELEIIFSTDTSTRKYKNLLNNPDISFTISDELISVQYQGRAEELGGEELKRCLEIYLKKVPSAKKYSGMPGQVYYKVTPKWIRFTNFETEPEEIFEVRF